MDNDISIIQQTELGILKHVLAICEKHGINYYMLGGTLLGAVRHQGIIPWDDDIDIGVPRPDYERLLGFLESELDEPYEIQTEMNQKGLYSYYYARVVDKTVLLRRQRSVEPVIIPAWIDLFPLDGVPKDPKVFDKWYKKCSRLYTLFMFSQFKYFYSITDVKGRRFRALKIFVKKAFYKLNLEKLINTRKAWCKLDKNLKKYDYNESDSVFNFCGAWGIKELFDKKTYGEGKIYKFEDLLLNGPEDYDTVLSQMYGDYMTPPSDADKNRHLVEIVR